MVKLVESRLVSNIFEHNGGTFNESSSGDWAMLGVKNRGMRGTEKHAHVSGIGSARSLGSGGRLLRKCAGAQKNQDRCFEPKLPGAALISNCATVISCGDSRLRRRPEHNQCS